ncbi:MAG TPA: type III-A CRISPR-associated RAMP protein Csm3 [Blastocatellia bacterium]|nr:type III-A CRISPR-associated RAMP protein Csm3 [Blastocatellia bacterium]
MSQFKASVMIRGKIECLSGLHIGGSGGGFQIGGIENSVVRNPIDDFPYIPGSSLKGKMRSLMEWALGRIDPQGRVYENSPHPQDDEILRIFGASAERERRAGPTRLLVRDAVPDMVTRELMQRLESEQGLPKVEIKTEISLNRITSRAESGPRQVERVPVGSRFNFGLVYGIYEVDGLRVHDVDLLDRVFWALRLVEDSALGRSGSRGYGQVRFHLGSTVIRTLVDYQSGASQPSGDETELSELTPLDQFSQEAVNKLKAELWNQIRPAPRPRIQPPAPKAEAPKAEAPKAEAPRAEAPEVPAPEVPAPADATPREAAPEVAETQAEPGEPSA